MPVRIPRRPPPFPDSAANSEAFKVILRAVTSHKETAVANAYLHWDDLRHRDPPAELSHEAWWWSLKIGRSANRRTVPLVDVAGRPFTYAPADPIPEQLHFLDQKTGGRLGTDPGPMTPEQRDRYHVNSLIEEAVRSSQIEGAATTREVAHELIRSGRKPRDRSEQMVLNNFQTMQRIVELRREPLTPALVLELQRMVTDGTLKDPTAAGRLRRAEESWVVVEDDEGNDLHVPPPADALPGRLQALCDFANADPPTPFVHPILRAIIVHFMLAYDHPFCDGNGRTARALFYWCMLHNDYWLFEFLSISSIVHKARKQYGRAFLLTETDEGDLTYFILYHLKVVRRAYDALDEYLDRKRAELQMAERELAARFRSLNHRQQALIQHALRHPGFAYTIESHQNSHKVVYETARTDLLDLAGQSLLDRRRRGRAYLFVAAADLAQRLAKD